VLDVNSGALHEVDSATLSLLGDNAPIAHTPDIDQLISAGLLYSNLPPNFNIDEFIEQRKNAPIKALCLNIAHDCNLRCTYCFADEGEYHGKRELMSLSTAQNAIDFLIARSNNRHNLEVDFFGGEPLMNFEVVKQTVEYAKLQAQKFNKNFRFTITTNGVLLDDDKINYINENFDNVVLSLDGRREVNDKMRPTANKKGSYDLIVPKFLKLISARHGKDYFVRGTFTKNNLDFFEDIKHISSLGFKNLSLEPVVADSSADYVISEEDLPKIFDEYDKLADDYINADYNFFHMDVDINGGPCAIKRLSGCGAGCEYVAITPNGDCYPCHQFVGKADFLMGNVNTNSTKISPRQDFAECNVLAKDECANCWAKFYCSGGCLANSYNFSGDINGNYDIGCRLQKKRIECALYIRAARQDSFASGEKMA
jgi:uncharacterized protein